MIATALDGVAVRVKASLTIAAIAALAICLVGCGGGSKSNSGSAGTAGSTSGNTASGDVASAIRSRMNSVVSHLNSGDGKAILDDDVPASARRTCSDNDAKQVVNATRLAMQASGTKLTVNNVGNVAVDGSHATADVTFGGIPGGASAPVNISFVKEHGDWLIDTGNETGCNGIIPGGLH